MNYSLLQHNFDTGRGFFGIRNLIEESGQFGLYFKDVNEGWRLLGKHSTAECARDAIVHQQTGEDWWDEYPQAEAEGLIFETGRWKVQIPAEGHPDHTPEEWGRSARCCESSLAPTKNK